MKKALFTTIIAALAIPAFAGTVAKDVIPPAPDEVTGGPYIALFGGAAFPHENDDLDLGFTTLSADHDTGWFAGLKAGYIFPTKVVKPVIELEGFYNRLDLGYSSDDLSASLTADTAAVLVNGIIRAEIGPVALYGGAGAGYYYAWADEASVTIGGETYSGDVDADSDGFAWQALGGIEYSITEQWSLFAEYKFLVYTDLDGDDLEQSLVGGGVKFRF